MPPLLFLGKIDSAPLEVALQILPEVRELQCRADVVRPFVKPPGIMTRNPQHKPADRVCRPPAIVKEITPARVARHSHVLTKRAQEILEESYREPALTD